MSFAICNKRMPPALRTSDDMEYKLWASNSLQPFSSETHNGKVTRGSQISPSQVTQ